MPAESRPAANDRRRLFDGLLGEYKDVAVHWRDELAPGSRIAGPALIAEAADHDRRVRGLRRPHRSLRPSRTGAPPMNA